MTSAVFITESTDLYCYPTISIDFDLWQRFIQNINSHIWEARAVLLAERRASWNAWVDFEARFLELSFLQILENNIGDGKKNILYYSRSKKQTEPASVLILYIFYLN